VQVIDKTIPTPYYQQLADLLRREISEQETENQVFQLSGPPDIAVIDAHSVVKASREDVGTVWDADSKPYKVVAQAGMPGGVPMAVIEAGFWKGANIEISCWQVGP